MDLVQIVPSLEPRHGGPSVSVPALSSALGALGHRVTLLATGPEAASDTRAHGLEVRISRRGWPEGICPSAGLRHELARLQPHAVHAHGLWLRPLHHAYHRTRELGVPLVISPRGMMSPWAWKHRRWRKALAARLVHPGALAGATGWHATSADEAQDIAALGFRQPVCVAPNGVRAPAPEELAAAEAHWRAACPAAFQRPTAVFYSRLHVKKRVLELIDLWLEQAPKDWLLLVVGIPEGYTVRELSEYVDREEGFGQVEIHDGTDVPPPYVAASVFLLPSHSENFGLVIAEALAHGLPAVVTDTTPWQGMARAGHGWCVPWEEYPGALSAALAEGPERLRTRGARAREWVLQECSWEKAALALERFYAQLR
jgi:glycosyltransferase involved in cell wall biosynthesis